MRMAQRRRKTYTDLYLPAKTMEFVIKSAALVNLVVEEVEVEVLQYVNIFFIAYCIFDRDNA